VVLIRLFASRWGVLSLGCRCGPRSQAHLAIGIRSCKTARANMSR
jgi:hypothetical protein